MSAPSDAVAEAIAQHRRLAATRLVRRDELDAELATATDETRVAALRAERAAVEAELRAAVAEINDLMRLSRTLPAPSRNVDDEVLSASAEQRALDNVRAHIRSLEAQVRVNDELRGIDETAAPEPPPPAPSGPRKKTM